MHHHNADCVFTNIVDRFHSVRDTRRNNDNPNTQEHRHCKEIYKSMFSIGISVVRNLPISNSHKSPHYNARSKNTERHVKTL